MTFASPYAVVLAFAGAVFAADAVAADLAAPLPADAASGAQPRLPPEPVIQRTVSEDKQVRIEELKVRGQTQTIVVQSKVPGLAPYEIITSTSGRDVGGAADGRAGASGQRVWQLFGF